MSFANCLADFPQGKGQKKTLGTFSTLGFARNLLVESSSCVLTQEIDVKLSRERVETSQVTSCW